MQAEHLRGREQGLEAKQLGEISDLPPGLAVAQRRAEHQRLASARTRQPEQQLHHRGLARPVGAEEAEDLASRHRHRQRLHGDRVAEALAQRHRVDRRGGRRPSERSRGRARSLGHAGGGVGGRSPRRPSMALRSAELVGDIQHILRIEDPGDDMEHARPSSQTTPAAALEGSAMSTPGQPATRTERTAAPGGTGTGRVVLRLPSRRTSSASAGGMPGWASKKASIWLIVAPVERAVGRRIVTTPSVGRSVPFAPAYSTRTAGPASRVTELRARPAAAELKVTVALTRG